MKENLYGDLSLLFYFYRKGLIGVWYCNLRNPVKASSLGHPRHIEARPQYKAFNIYKPEDWKTADPIWKEQNVRILPFS
jgi:hypothetical protein